MEPRIYMYIARACSVRNVETSDARRRPMHFNVHHQEMDVNLKSYETTPSMVESFSLQYKFRVQAIFWHDFIYIYIQFINI